VIEHVFCEKSHTAINVSGKRSIRMTPAMSPANHVVWLDKLWLATLFLLLCGAAFLAIPVGDLHITAGRIALATFLYVFTLAVFLHHKLALRVKVVWHVIFFMLWLVWAFVSLCWTSVNVYSARHIEGLIIGTAIILFSLLFLSHRDGLRSLHKLWVFAAAVFVTIAVWEVATGLHLSVSREAEWVGLRQTYPTAVFHNPNDLATYLCLALPFMFGLLMILKATKARVLVATLLLVSFYLIVLNSSRANIVASLIGVGLVLFMPGVKQRLRSIAVVFVVGGIGLLLGYAFFSEAMTSHLDILKALPEQISSLGAGGVSMTTRIELIRNGWEFLQQSNYLGIGAGAFEYWMIERPIYYAGGIINPHNWWLELLVNYGVGVFVLFLVFYLGVLRSLFHIFRSSQDRMLKVVSLATFVALVEFAVANASSSGLMRHYGMWLLFATALCVINYYRITKHKKKGERHLGSEAYV